MGTNFQSPPRVGVAVKLKKVTPRRKDGANEGDGKMDNSNSESPNEVVVNDMNFKVKSSWTIGIVRYCFPWVFSVSFWLLVIGSIIAGVNFSRIISIGLNEDLKTLAPLVGGLLGLIIGFLIAVSINGVVATILKMDENLQYLADRENERQKNEI